MACFSDFEALSFDCYGTLIDWETGLTQAFREWSDAIDVERALELFGSIETEKEQKYPSAPYPEILVRVCVALGEMLDVPVSAEQAAIFGASVGRWPAFPDSSEALAKLQQRYKLIILSNVDRGSFFLSETRLGINFDAVITAQDVGSYKPDLRNFEALFRCAGKMGIARDKILHVAQSRFHDHEPAQKLGLNSVWIDRRHHLAGPGATPESTLSDADLKWRFPSMKTFADAVFEVQA